MFYIPLGAERTPRGRKFQQIPRLFLKLFQYTVIDTIEDINNSCPDEEARMLIQESRKSLI